MKKYLIISLFIGSCWAQKVDYVQGLKNQPIYIAAWQNLNSVVSLAPVGSTIVITPGNYTVTAALVIPTNTNVTCQDGVKIFTSYNGPHFKFLAKGASLNNCYLDGGESTHVTWAKAVIFVGADSVTLNKITIRNQGNTNVGASNWGIYGCNSSNLHIINPDIIANGGNGNGNGSDGGIQIDASATGLCPTGTTGTTAKSVIIMGGVVENPFVNGQTAGTYGNAVRLGLLDSTGNFDGYSIGGGITIKNGGGRFGLEVWSGTHVDLPDTNWRQVNGGHIIDVHFITENQIGTHISVANHNSAVITNITLDDGGFPNPFGAIEDGGTFNSIWSHISEFNCGTPASNGFNVSFNTDGSGTGNLVTENSFCGNREIIIQNYPNEIGYVNNIDSHNLYTWNTNSFSSVGFAITLTTNSALPITGNKFDNDIFFTVGTNASAIAVVSTASTATISGNVISNNTAIGFKYGIINGSFNSGAPVNNILDGNSWNASTSQFFGNGEVAMFNNIRDIGYDSILNARLSAPGIIQSGASPTCVSGVGLDGAGSNSCTSGVFAGSTPFAGEVSLTASGTPTTPTTTGVVVATLTVASGYFKTQAPFCIVSNTAAGTNFSNFTYNIGGTSTTTKLEFDIYQVDGATAYPLIAGHTYRITWHCSSNF